MPTGGPIYNPDIQSDIDMKNTWQLINVPATRINSLIVFNVKNYGAKGDGTTDDTTAITNAYNDIPSTGGVLYFPASSAAYKVTSGFTISKPITILGDGSGTISDNSTLARSVISFSTTTGTLFTNTANGVTFRDIQLTNPNTGPMTSGAGISTTTNGNFTRYQNIRIDNFYIGIDHQTGTRSLFESSHIQNPTLYGLKLQDTGTSQAGGDSEISGCFFDAHINTLATGNAAIAIVGGGGYRFSHNKINGVNLLSPFWTYGVLLNFVSGENSEDLLFINNSVEGVDTGIYATTVDNTPFFQNWIIVGNQFELHADNPTIYLNPLTTGLFGNIVIDCNASRALVANTNPMIKLVNCSTIAIGISNTHEGHAGISLLTNCSASSVSLQNVTSNSGSLNYGLEIDNIGTLYNANPQSGIQFGLNYTSTNTLAGVGGISVGKQNSSDGDYSSFLSLFTRKNGSNVSESMRIAPDSSLYNDGGLNANVLITNQTPYNSNPLCGIEFNNKYDVGGDTAGMGGIAVGKNNPNSGDYGGYLGFYTRVNGAPSAEVGRFSSAGGFSVGTTTDPGAGNATINGTIKSSGHFVETQNNKNAANGYCPLDAGSKVPAANLPTLSSGTIASTLLPLAGDNSGNAVAASVSGTGAVVLATGATLVTPTIGVAAATSVNKWAFTAPATAATLTAGADSLTYTMPEISTKVGFRHIPQNSQSAAYTTVLNDSGKHIYHPASDANARTFTIDSNANVAYPIGTAITFANLSANTVTIAITADTMYLAGVGTTGSRALGQYGTATALKTNTTEWVIQGVGLS